MSRSIAELGRAPHPDRVRSRMNYFYFYFWRGLLLEKYRTELPANHLPNVPALYLFGEKKRYMFHSAEWLEHFQKLSNASVAAIPSAGHWLVRDNASKTNAAIRSWLETT